MSAKTKQAPAGASSAINGIASQPDSLHMAQSLKTAITTFTSDIGFRTLSQLADRIPRLEDDITKKDDQIHALTAQLDGEREAHVTEQQKELGNFGQMYRTLQDEKATLQDTIDELKNSLQDMDKNRAALQKELDEAMGKGRELKGKYEAKITKLKEKDQELADLWNQLQVTHASANDSSKKLNESRGRVVTLEKSLESSAKQHDSLQRMFNETNDRLNELRGFSAPLYDVDIGTVAKDLESVWKSATSVVAKFLRQELLDEMLQNDWAGLRDNTLFKLQVPLPQSNSETAKEMRIAMVVGILARLVDQYIFQPTYILDDESGLRELLRRQVAVDDKKEAFTRGVFLSMFPQEQVEWAKKGREMVMEILINNVVVHFLAPADIPPFRKELEHVVFQAQECWRTVQYCNQRLEPSFRYTHDTNIRWETFEFQIANPREEKQSVSPITTDDPEDELFVIFPRVYLVKVEHPITSGVLLRRAQFRAAEQEVRESASRAPFTEPSSKRHRPRRNRDISVSGDGAPGGPSAFPFLRQATWV